MTTTLITGANKGLGRETARRLVQAGHDVYLGARDPERGAAAARELGCRFVVLVVLDDDSVTAAADTVEQQQGALDVLINNAGITGGPCPRRTRPPRTCSGSTRPTSSASVVVAEELADGAVPGGDPADDPVGRRPLLARAAVRGGAEQGDEAGALEQRDLVVGGGAGSVAGDGVGLQDLAHLAGPGDPPVGGGGCGAGGPAGGRRSDRSRSSRFTCLPG